jgi:hypothetical protein
VPTDKDAAPEPTAASSDVHFPTEDEKLDAALDALYSTPAGEYEIKIVDGSLRESKVTASGRYSLDDKTSQGHLTLHSESGDTTLAVRTVGQESFLSGEALPTTRDDCWLPATELPWQFDFHQLDLRQITPLREARALRIVGDDLMIAFPAATAAAMFPDGLLPDRLPRLPRDAEIDVMFSSADDELSYLVPGGSLATLYIRAGVPARELPVGSVSLQVTVTPQDDAWPPTTKPAAAQLATASSGCPAT